MGMLLVLKTESNVSENKRMVYVSKYLNIIV